MKLSIFHSFACSPAELMSVLDDPTFDARLAAQTGVVREIIERREDANESYVRSRVLINKEVPAIMAKAIGSDRISYEQESRRNRTTFAIAWNIIPMVLASKFQGSGTTVVRATPNGCERVIEGDLVVKVPVIGKQMETKLLESIEESYNRAASLAAEMLTERA